MAHYLNEIILAENPAVAKRDLFCGIEIARRKRTRDLARQTRRKADKPLAVLAEQLKIYARTAVKALGIRKRSQLREVVVARFVLAEKYQMKRALVRVFIKARIFGNVDLAADNGLDPSLFRRATAAKRLPWSVTAQAFWPSAFAASASSFTRQAPSRSEYSL